MDRRHILIPTLVMLAVSTLHAAHTARGMYSAAHDREQEIRAALADEDGEPPRVTELRAIVAAYQAVVRRFPASGYSDNALWQAGRLALDAFERFGDPQDRQTGVRLLQSLARNYPASKLARRASEVLRTEQAPPVRPAAGAVPVEANRLSPTKIGTEATRASAANDGAEAGSPAAAIAGVEPARATAQSGVAHPAIVMINDIRRMVLPGTVRIVIELDGEVSFHDELITGPDRFFIDLAGTRIVPPLVDRTLRFGGDGAVIRQVRIGMHPNRTTRVVLDAAGVASYSVYPLYNPYRLVVDCVPATASHELMARAETTSSPATLPARPLVLDWRRRLPSTSPRAGRAIRDALAQEMVPARSDSVSAAAPPPAPAAPSTSPTPPAKNLAGGLSIARQLGLGVSRVVIDPGHGGYDPGAKGKGVMEAELVLDVALRLEQLLQKLPGVEVVLTRRTDDFVPLQERTAIANREGADLFLSIHANASTNGQARGIETYFLNFANNLSAATVAARENAASGRAMGALPDIVKAIALNNKLDESRDFATFVQRSMVERLRGANKAVRDLGVKQAPFVVLIGAAMPSVLAEISFVTNAPEARLLRGSAYRQRIADALLNAIQKYQGSLHRLTTIAHQ